MAGAAEQKDHPKAGVFLFEIVSSACKLICAKVVINVIPNTLFKFMHTLYH